MWKTIYNWMNKLSGKNLSALLIVGGIVFFLAIAYSTWAVKRWFNYSLGYKSQVTSTICEMVKPEYLKNPGKCK